MRGAPGQLRAPRPLRRVRLELAEGLDDGQLRGVLINCLLRRRVAPGVVVAAQVAVHVVVAAPQIAVHVVVAVVGRFTNIGGGPVVVRGQELVLLHLRGAARPRHLGEERVITQKSARDGRLQALSARGRASTPRGRRARARARAPVVRAPAPAPRRPAVAPAVRWRHDRGRPALGREGRRDRRAAPRPAAAPRAPAAPAPAAPTAPLRAARRRARRRAAARKAPKGGGPPAPPGTMPKGGGAPPQGGTACPKGGGAWPKGGGAPGGAPANGAGAGGAPAPAGAAPPCVIQAGIVAPRPRPTGAAGMDGVSSFFLGDSERLLRDDRLRSRSLSLLLLRLRRRRERDGIATRAVMCLTRAQLSAQRVAQVCVARASSDARSYALRRSGVSATVRTKQQALPCLLVR